MRTNTSANPLIIGSTCLVLELQDEKHVAIKLCISTIVVCNCSVLCARSFLAYLFSVQNQLFVQQKHKAMPEPEVQYSRYNQKQKTVQLWKHTRAREDVEMQDVYLNQKSSDLQR